MIKFKGETAVKSGEYKTKNKQIILEYLKNNANVSITVKDICKYFADTGDSINITTIYRYLDKLSSEGTVMKYTSDDGKSFCFKYMDENRDCHEHFHLQCRSCGKIIHLDCSYMDDIIKHISDCHDFDLKCDNSVLYGKCHECRNKEK